VRAERPLQNRRLNVTVMLQNFRVESKNPELTWDDAQDPEF